MDYAEQNSKSLKVLPRYTIFCCAFVFLPSLVNKTQQNLYMANINTYTTEKFQVDLYNFWGSCIYS